MTWLPAADVIERARSRLTPHWNEAGSGAGIAHLVRRLDIADSAYYLVIIGPTVACLDARTGELLASATASSPLRLSADAARDRAGLGSQAAAELVWKPSSASLSMFDPLWSVGTATATVYVDQRGHVYDALHAKRPGG